MDLKCNKTEMRLRKLVRQLLKIIVDDINSRYAAAYDYRDLEINIVRETMVNENDIANNEKIEKDCPLGHPLFVNHFYYLVIFLINF